MNKLPKTRSLHGFAGLALLLMMVRFSSRADARPIPRNHQAWSTEEGLPGSSVHHIFQSQDGYLWVATESGVARFDGFSFKVLRHDTSPAFLSDDVTAIVQDSHGVLWFGTSEGLVEDRGSTQQRLGVAEGLPSAAVVALAALPDGSLLVLTSAGVCRLDGAGCHAVRAAGGQVLSFVRAPDGGLWLLTPTGLERYREGHALPGQDGSRSHFPATGLDSPKGIQYGPGNITWSWSSRFLRAEGPGLSRVLTIGRDLPGTRVTALLVDRAGSAWVGTNRGCLLVQPGARTPVQAIESLRLETVLSFLEDREGNLWIGTEASGLHVLRPRRFMSEPSVAGEAVTAGVTASDGSVWIGTREDGVRRIVNGVSTTPVPAGSLVSPIVLSLAAGPHGDLWVGTPDGLDHVHSGRVTHFSSLNGLPDDFVRSLLVDSHGVVWAGTRRGLARLEGEAMTTLTQAEGLSSNSIGPMVELAGQAASETGKPRTSTLWIGTAAGLTSVQGDRLESFSPGQAPPGNVVTALASAGQDSLWVGLHGMGLSRFDGHRFRPVSNGMLPREITALASDGRGSLWMRGERGIYQAPVSALQGCIEKEQCSFKVGHFGTADGMPSDLLTAEGTPGVWEGPAGDLWFSTLKGIARIDPAHLPYDSVPPPVAIEHFLVDDHSSSTDTANVTIDPGHRRYVFNFIALSYTAPLSNRYRYMLEGLDRDWVDAGSARSASYTSLPARQYRFRVQAQNPDGVWNQEGADLRFRVLAPVYRRGWFLALLIFLGGAIVLGIFRLRLRSVQARFDLIVGERNRVAREIHDTLAQDLIGVSLQVDMAAQLLKGGELARAAAQLETTRKAVREGLDAARQSIWNLRTNTDNSLPSRLTELCSRLAETYGNRPRLRIGGSFRQLPAVVEDNVYRIAQECLTNSFRHANASEISVHLRYNPDSLRLALKDDGRGFLYSEARQLEGHYGLNGMHERAETLKAGLSITTCPGKGTETILSVPLTGEEHRA